MSPAGVRPEVDRAVRAGGALAARLNRAAAARARAGTPQEQRLWGQNMHRRAGRLQEWAAAVRAQLGPRIDELNIRELDFLNGALTRAEAAFGRAGRGAPASIGLLRRLIASRLRVPVP
jgi:hypothetical protein